MLLFQHVFLPSFINKVYYKCAENEEDEESNEHVVDRPDMVHFKQLTGEEVQMNIIISTHTNSILFLRYFLTSKYLTLEGNMPQQV